MASVVLIEANDLRSRHGDRDVLRGVDLVVRQGERLALVGSNGSGKSTLLALLAGALAPDGGRLRLAPGAQVAWLAQHADVPAGLTLLGLAEGALGPVRALEAELERAAARIDTAGTDTEAATARYLELLSLFEERGGFEAAGRLRSTLARLGLPEETWDREVAACSGGERQRARIAGVLAAGADVVLLDEPTNHLDMAAREALADALRAHRGAVVLASHDRALLDAVATHVATLEGGRLERRRGTYSSVVRDRASARRAEERAARERAKRAAVLDTMAAELARHGHRTAATRRRRAERERDALGATATAARGPGRPPGALATATGTARGELLVAAHLGAEGIVDDAALRIDRGDRIALVGPSGSGKSTLLRLLTGERASDDPRGELRYATGVRVLSLDQTWRGLHPDETPHDALTAWVRDARAAQILQLVGLPHGARARAASQLSGGERARAGLALLVAREADLIVLDEPTNDLDLGAIETLEATLEAADAAIVVATHDAHLIEALGAEVWAIEGRELVRYRGGLAGYRRGARRLERDLVGETPPDGAPDDGAPGDGAPGDRASGAGATIEEVEDELALAERRLLDPGASSLREIARWRSRRDELEARRLELWEASAPAPMPRFRTREGGVRIWADRDGDGLRVWLDEGPVARVRRIGGVGHVVAEHAVDRSVLPWARRALYDGAARLALYLLSVHSVQVATDVDLAHGPYVPLAPGWWVAHRGDLERREGWRTTTDDGGPPRPAGRARRRRRGRGRRTG